MENEFIANRALADELKKMFRLIEKAHQQIFVGNYGIAKGLLDKVLCDGLNITIVDIDETKE